MTDGAQQQCSVLEVISGDIDGTPAAQGWGVGSFRVTWAAVLSASGFHKERCRTNTSYTFLLKQKKQTPVAPVAQR